MKVSTWSRDGLLCDGALQLMRGSRAHLIRQLAGVARALALHIHEASVALALARERPHAAALVVVLAVLLGRQAVPARLVGRRVQVARIRVQPKPLGRAPAMSLARATLLMQNPNLCLYRFAALLAIPTCVQAAQKRVQA